MPKFSRGYIKFHVAWNLVADISSPMIHRGAHWPKMIISSNYNGQRTMRPITWSLLACDQRAMLSLCSLINTMSQWSLLLFSQTSVCFLCCVADLQWKKYFKIFLVHVSDFIDLDLPSPIGMFTLYSGYKPARTGATLIQSQSTIFFFLFSLSIGCLNILIFTFYELEE